MTVGFEIKLWYTITIYDRNYLIAYLTDNSTLP